MDLSRSELDAVHLNKVRRVWRRNVRLCEDRHPALLRAELSRLRASEVELSNARADLYELQAKFDRNNESIRAIELSSAALLAEEERKRADLDQLIARHTLTATDAQEKMRAELESFNGVRAQHRAELAHYEAELNNERRRRNERGDLLAQAERELDWAVRGRPAQLNALKAEIATLRTRAATANTLATAIKGETARIVAAIKQNAPVPHIAHTVKRAYEEHKR